MVHHPVNIGNSCILLLCQQSGCEHHVLTGTLTLFLGLNKKLMIVMCHYESTYTLCVAQPVHIRHLLCEIWGFHGGVYEDYCLQGCDATKYQHLKSLNHYGRRRRRRRRRMRRRRRSVRKAVHFCVRAERHYSKGNLLVFEVKNCVLCRYLL